MDGPPFSVSLKDAKQLYDDKFKNVQVLSSTDILQQDEYFQSQGLSTRCMENLFVFSN